MQRVAALLLRVAAEYPLLAGLMRYAIVGGIVSALGTIVYLVPAVIFHVPPLIANFLSYLVAVSIGYLLHQRFSFPNADPRLSPRQRSIAFFLVSLVGLALDSLFVWIVTGPMGLSPWWPLPAMLLVTPLITFYCNRRWVFA